MFYVLRGEKKLKCSLQCSKSTFLPSPPVVVTWFVSVSDEEDIILKHILQKWKSTGGTHDVYSVSGLTAIWAPVCDWVFTCVLALDEWGSWFRGPVSRPLSLPFRVLK